MGHMSHGFTCLHTLPASGGADGEVCETFGKWNLLEDVCCGRFTLSFYNCGGFKENGSERECGTIRGCGLVGEVCHCSGTF